MDISFTYVNYQRQLLYREQIAHARKNCEY